MSQTVGSEENTSPLQPTNGQGEYEKALELLEQLGSENITLSTFLTRVWQGRIERRELQELTNALDSREKAVLEALGSGNGTAAGSFDKDSHSLELFRRYARGALRQGDLWEVIDQVAEKTMIVKAAIERLNECEWS